MELKQKYEIAKKEYEKWGINVDEVLRDLSKVKISIHCWQGDDVTGFEANQQNYQEELHLQEIILEKLEILRN